MDQEQDQKTTIYIGNLPQHTTDQDLYAYFTTFGQIKSIQIPKDHMTQRIRGFAFVEFDERDDAGSAIDNYDKSEFMGRTIKVRRARPLDKKPNYHTALWANDEWVQQAEMKKMEAEKLTKEQQEKSRQLGLPIYKEVKPKEDDKTILYVEQ